MTPDLLPYYERELLSLRKLSGEFAARYPERAAALQISREGCDDPHVERILQGFALIAGRIQRKLDDEFPEVTQSLLEMLYPHLLRPVPSMAVLQFELDPELSKSTTGHPIPRGTLVYAAPQGGVQCRFRTAYETRLWPLELSSAAFLQTSQIAGLLRSAGSGDERYAVRLELEIKGGATLDSLDLRELRFRLGGDTQAAYWMYELLFNHVARVLVRSRDISGELHTTVLAASSITPVGFERDEALLPYAETSFSGYRLLQEYFCFPQKFLFFDLGDFASVPKHSSGSKVEILFLLKAFEQSERERLLEAAVNIDMFQLGCVPAINLFSHSADPIRVSHTRTEYPIVPDVHAPDGMEVYSVDRLVAVTSNTEAVREYKPFYSHHHGGMTGAAQAFWFATRRSSERANDAGTEVFVSLVDQRFTPAAPATESVTAHLTCSNRDQPASLHLDGTWGELDLENGAAVKARTLFGPTETIRAVPRRDLQWRLISHLSLNHLSLVEGGAEALREMLRLYDTALTAGTTRQIEGLRAVRSARKMARLNGEFGFVFAQGIAVELELDEEKFAGGSAFLFASVLDRFFGLYCSVNSFTQLRVSTQQRKGVVWQRPLRSGEQAVA